jgi:hypothetical protein
MRLRHSFVALLVPCVLLALSAPAVAARDTGAGPSMVLGATAFDPAPTLGFEMSLPALEIAVGLPTVVPAHLRLRSPLLDTVISGVARQQLDFQLDLMLLLTPFATPDGVHAIRPVLGPWLGGRINVQHAVSQVGFAVGGRFGAEYVGPARKSGVGIGFEPFFQLQSGPAGAGRTSTVVGGGGMFVLFLTAYQAPEPAPTVDEGGES